MIKYNFQKVADEGGGVVRHGLCGVQANKKVNVGGHGDVREPVQQDLQSDAGDECFVVWRVGVLGDRRRRWVFASRV